MLVSVNIGFVPDKTLPKAKPGIDMIVRTHAKMEIQKLIKGVEAAIKKQEPMETGSINRTVAVVTRTIAMNSELLDKNSAAFRAARRAVDIGEKFPALGNDDYQNMFIALGLFLEATERLV